MCRYIYTILFFICVIGVLAVGTANAQRPGAQSRNQNKNKKDKEPEYPPLPTDKRLLALHQKFVNDAEKLAGEYEKGRDLDRAKSVYEEILKLVPQYESARAKLEAIKSKEASAERALFTVKANLGWQDTGIKVIEGKPIAIRAAGTWTYTLEADLNAEGMSIPEELKDFNLGCLIGAVDTGNREDFKPFVIGAEKSFVAEKPGKLYVRMYDIEPKDNDGFLKLEFMGSFDKR